MAFTAFYFIAAVDATFFAIELGLDALRVDDALAGLARFAVFFAVFGSTHPTLSPSPHFLFQRLKWS